MTANEKGDWLLNEVLHAGLNVDSGLGPSPEFVVFKCPWGASYKVLNTEKRLRSFAASIQRCPGFGGPAPRGIPNGPIRARAMSLKQFNKKYDDDDDEVTYALDP